MDLEACDYLTRTMISRARQPRRIHAVPAVKVAPAAWIRRPISHNGTLQKNDDVGFASANTLIFSINAFLLSAMGEGSTSQLNFAGMSE